MNLDIYLIRHGVTDSLEKRLFAGKTDIPLNKKGLSQVEALASRADLRDIQQCFSSPLSRCRQTAMAAFPGRNIFFDDRLSEIDFGLWEMKSWEEISFRWPHDTEKWASPDNRFCFPDGECFDDFVSRLRAAASDLENTLLENTFFANTNNGTATAAITAHSGVIKVLVCLWLGLPVVNYNRFSVEPASVSLVRISDGYGYLAFLNDTSHLK